MSTTLLPLPSSPTCEHPPELALDPCLEFACDDLLVSKQWGGHAVSRIDRLVDFVRTVDFGTIPSDVREVARGLTLDTLGALIQASSPRYSAGRILMDFAQAQGGTPESSIVGGGFQTSAVQAALVNGTLGY